MKQISTLHEHANQLDNSIYVFFYCALKIIVLFFYPMSRQYKMIDETVYLCNPPGIIGGFREKSMTILCVVVRAFRTEGISVLTVIYHWTM